MTNGQCRCGQLFSSCVCDELEAERNRRRGLERRFDARLEGVGVAERVNAWASRVAPLRDDEWRQCREDMTALVLWAQGLKAVHE